MKCRGRIGGLESGRIKEFRARLLGAAGTRELGIVNEEIRIGFENIKIELGMTHNGWE